MSESVPDVKCYKVSDHMVNVLCFNFDELSLHVETLCLSNISYLTPPGERPVFCVI